MSKQEKITRAMREQELREQIKASRDSLMATLSELQEQAQPRTQAVYLKDNLIHKAQEAGIEALNTVDDARDGDPEARKKVLIAAGVTAGLIALRIIRRKIKRRKR